MKTKASGYPYWVRTPEDVDHYIANFRASEGVLLDKEAVKPNAVKRGLAKVCLNSMRRKLTEGNEEEISPAYVTAGARLHLYMYLDTLQERAIYCDTDSVKFVQPSAESPLVERGDCLGAMTSELKPSEYIDEFVSGGPKNYA